jgi:glycosyltransferase involved in cell wall biosynthesis
VKVCFVTANYPPEALGGTEQVAAALARELRALGVELFVVSGSEVRSSTESVVAAHAGVPVFRLPRRPDELQHPGAVLPRLPALVRGLLERHRPDVVHVHGFTGLGLGLTAIGRQLGMRVVVTFHDLWVTCARFFRVPASGITCPVGVDRTPCVACVNTSLQTDPGVVALGLAERDRLLRAECALADLCIAPSVATARAVREHLPYDEPIAVVPHGRLRPVPAEHLAARWRPGEVLRVGMFGGLVAVKGVLELVDAVAGLPCELHLSGPFHEPGFAATVQARAAAHQTRLVLRPRYTDDDRHPARDLHLAVFPSKCQESYGLVVDEALAHGVPAVLSDQGAFAERAGQGGVRVTPLAGLAAVLRELVGSPDRIAALRAQIPAELPSITTSAIRHLELYSRLR